MTTQYVIYSVTNLRKACTTLERFVALPVKDDRDRAGIIQAFEYSYELAWKTLKKIAEYRGLEAATPVEAFRAGLQMRYIEINDQDTWLAMKNSRNLTSHTYRESLAEGVVEDIVLQYLPLLIALREALTIEFLSPSS